MEKGSIVCIGYDHTNPYPCRGRRKFSNRRATAAVRSWTVNNAMGCELVLGQSPDLPQKEKFQRHRGYDRLFPTGGIPPSRTKKYPSRRLRASMGLFQIFRPARALISSMKSLGTTMPPAIACCLYSCSACPGSLIGRVGSAGGVVGMTSRPRATSHGSRVTGHGSRVTGLALIPSCINWNSQPIFDVR